MASTSVPLPIVRRIAAAWERLSLRRAPEPAFQRLLADRERYERQIDRLEGAPPPRTLDIGRSDLIASGKGRAHCTHQRQNLTLHLLQPIPQRAERGRIAVRKRALRRDLKGSPCIQLSSWGMSAPMSSTFRQNSGRSIDLKKIQC